MSFLCKEDITKIFIKMVTFHLKLTGLFSKLYEDRIIWRDHRPTSDLFGITKLGYLHGEEQKKELNGHLFLRIL